MTIRLQRSLSIMLVFLLLMTAFGAVVPPSAVHAAPAQTVLYQNGFEDGEYSSSSGAEGWSNDGAWLSVTGSAISGSHSLKLYSKNAYLPSTNGGNGYGMSYRIDGRGSSDILVSFSYKGSKVGSGSNDGDAYVEVSYDGGVTYSILKTFPIADLTSSTPVQVFSQALGAEAAGNSDILLRIRSKNGNSSRFYALDDLKIEAVPVAPQAVHVDPSAVSLRLGESATVIASVYPDEASQSVSWMVNDPEHIVAFDEATGQLTAAGVGTASLRAASVIDPAVYADIPVTVSPSMTSKAITSFSVPSVAGSVYGEIDQAEGTITVTLPPGASLVKPAAFRTTGSRVTVVGGTEQVSGVTVNDFTGSDASPLQYRVYALDGSFRDYAVSVASRDPSDKSLNAFAFASLTPRVTASMIGTDVRLAVPADTDVTRLAPTFSYIGKKVTVAGVVQKSGVTVQDFTNPVVYSVYADDGSYRDYEVQVVKQLPLTPVNLALGKRVSSPEAYPSGGSTSTVLTDGNTRTTLRRLTAAVLPNYFQVDLGAPTRFNQITVREALQSGLYRTTGFLLLGSNDLTQWTKLGEGTTIGDEKSISFPAVTERYVRLLITGEDQLDIPIFSELEVYDVPQSPTSIVLPQAITLDWGGRTTLSAEVEPLAASDRVMWSSADRSIASVQADGTVAGVAAGTTQIVAASVADPSIHAAVTITVNPQLSADKQIDAYSLTAGGIDYAGSISGNTIAVRLPEGTDASGLVAAFHTNGDQAAVAGVRQMSGVTLNDFRSPVVYMVTAADGSTQSYTVTVSMPSAKRDLQSFSFDGLQPAAVGTIGSAITGRTILPGKGGYYTVTDVYDNRVSVIVPDQTDLTHLKASFTTNGHSVLVGGVEQQGGITENDFSSPLIYEVIAEDGSVKDYTVTVYRNPADAVVSVSDQVTGKSMKYVGFSSQVMTRGDNQAAWYDYTNVNGARYWISPRVFVSTDNIKTDSAVSTVDAFDRMKGDMRQRLLANPADETFINWADVERRMNELDSTSGTETLNDTLDRLTGQGIDVIAELHYSTADYANDADKWEQSWERWQMFYAEAFELAKNHDIHQFEATNEPELNVHVLKDASNPEERAQGVQQFVFLLKIYKDAVKSAIEDVNKLEGKSLVPILAGPTLASAATSDVSTETLKGNRTDYHGTTVDYNIIDWFVKHKYSKDPAAMKADMEQLQQQVATYSPSGPIPIIYTEFNYSTQADWKNRDITSDDPEVVQTEAMTWQYAMTTGMYGMYQFKFAEEFAGKNMNNVFQQFNRLRDPSQNLALNKPITASSNEADEGKAIDGISLDDSAWISGSETMHTLTVDLLQPQTIRSYAFDIGDAYYSTKLKKFTNVFGNFKLEASTDGTTWTEIPGTGVGSNSDNSKVGNLLTPVTARYVRFTATSSSAGTIKVRDLYLSSDPLRSDIGGPLKSAEVTRLFAEGFKNERDLYQTTAQVLYDDSYQASTSFDPDTNRFYIWIPESSHLVDYRTTVDLTGLKGKLQPGSLVTVKEVSANHFGDVVYSAPLDASLRFTMIQPKQSVWLVTVQNSEKLVTADFSPSDEAQVKLADSAAAQDGTAGMMQIAQSVRSPGDDSAVYMKYTVDRSPSEAKQVLLHVYGKLNADAPVGQYAVHVYGIANDDWDEDGITADIAPNLNRHGGYIEASETGAVPVGILTFTKAGGSSTIDVTDYVREHGDQTFTFALVKEQRSMLEDNSGSVVTIASKENGEVGERPYLEWSASDTTPPVILIDAPTAKAYDDNATLTIDYTVSDDLSGVDASKTVAQLDGEPVAQGASIPLYTLALGTHTLTVQSTDRVGNASQAQTVFQTTATIESLKALIALFVEQGQITSSAWSNSLLDKLEEGEMKGFIAEVKAQSGKKVSELAAGYLIRDAKAVEAAK